MLCLLKQVPCGVVHYSALSVTSLQDRNEPPAGVPTRSRLVSQVTVVIPAFLNTDVDILDDTLRAHARLAYRGPLTVLLVYCKEPAGAAGHRLEEAEHELCAAWAGREEGNIRCADDAATVVKPHRCCAGAIGADCSQVPPIFESLPDLRTPPQPV